VGGKGTTSHDNASVSIWQQEMLAARRTQRFIRTRIPTTTRMLVFAQRKRGRVGFCQCYDNIRASTARVGAGADPAVAAEAGREAPPWDGTPMA
jgi:hypothetical protein